MSASLQLVRVFVIVVLVQLSIYFWIFVRKLRARQHFESLSQALRTWRTKDATRARVQSVARKKRLERLSFVSEVIMAVLGLLLALLLWGRGLISFLWRDDVEVDMIRTFGYSGLGQVFLVFSAFMTTKVRCILTHGLLNLLYVISVAALFSLLYFATNENEYLATYAFTICARLVMIMIDGELTFSILINLCFTISHTAMFISRFKTMADLRGTGVYELSIFIFISVFAVLANMSLRRNILATLDAKESRNFKTVGASLLSVTCDAVVHLSSALEISYPSPQLNALLLRQGPPEALQGTKFAALIYDEGEKANFEAFVNRSSRATEALYVHLRDSACNPVRIQLLHATGLDVVDQTFHILGIRELDPTQHQLPSAELRAPDAWTAGLGAVYDDLPMHSISEGGGSSWEGSHSDATQIDLVNEEGVAVWFEPFTHIHEMLRATYEFKKRIGKIRKHGALLECLKTTNQIDFEKWLEFSLNMLVSGRSNVERKQFTFQVKRRKGCKYTRVTAEISLEDLRFEDDSSNEADDPTQVAKLSLTKATSEEQQGSLRAASMDNDASKAVSL